MKQNESAFNKSQTGHATFGEHVLKFICVEESLFFEPPCEEKISPNYQEIRKIGEITGFDW